MGGVGCVLVDEFYAYEQQLRARAAQKRGGIKYVPQLPKMHELLRVRKALQQTALSQHVRERDTLIVDFLRVYMLRISEVMSLNVRAFDFSRQEFTIFPFYEKNAREKTYSLQDAPPWFVQHLARYLRVYGRTFRGGYLFPSTSMMSEHRPFVRAATWISCRWNKAVAHAGLAEFRLTLDGRKYHRLRTHHFRTVGITGLLQSGWSIREVQAFTQHGCPETIMHYYWLLDAQKTKRAIMREHMRHLKE